MTPDASTPLATAVLLMTTIASVACIVNAAELLSIRASWARDGIWSERHLGAGWGHFRWLLRAEVFAIVQRAQIGVASLLATSVVVAGLRGTSAPSALAVTCIALLAVASFLAAMRFRGTVNGGSDGMLFTVLLGVAVAQSSAVPPLVREGAVLYVAAQLTLSYVRAGVVKIRHRAWWRGDALSAFLQLPAYGVPAWVPRTPGLLRALSIAVMAFECAAPIAWFDVRLAALFLGVAVAFHLATAVVFGLNRFVLAWGAAMPALWYAATRA